MGRRDNKYKARIKILVFELGIEKLQKMVEDEWAEIKDGPLALPQAEIDRIAGQFPDPPWQPPKAARQGAGVQRLLSPAFADWTRVNTAAHKQPGSVIVNLPLKPPGGVPGDAKIGRAHV